MNKERVIETLLRKQAALANFGSFALGETDLQKILMEAASICAQCMEVPFAKICRYRTDTNDLLIEAGCGWHKGVVGHVVSPADESSTQGRAFITGNPVILEDLSRNASYALPPFYADHGIVATADVPIKGKGGPWGVLEIDSPVARAFDRHDIDFLTGFANVVAEAVSTAERTAVLLTAVVEKDRLLVERQKLLDEKGVLAEELQHRVRNNLLLVIAMLNQHIHAGNGTEQEGIRSIARRVSSLANIYDHLLGKGLGRTIDFSQYLRSLCESLRDFQGAREFGVTILCEDLVAPLPLDLDLVTVLGLVVAEIISNANAHAFPGRAGLISVKLERSGTDATLTIADNGIGFVEARLSKRHGLGLVKRLMQQIDGSVRVVSVGGTEWTLGFSTTGATGVSGTIPPSSRSPVRDEFGLRVLTH